MAFALASVALGAVVQMGISYLFPAEGPRMKDLKVTASTYGNVIPEVYGVCRVAGNMIWSSEIQERKKKRMAGKGGGFYNEYTYFGNFAMAFCRGPVKEVRRVWADGKLIYDVTGNSPAVNNGKFNFRIYYGDEEQVPDSTIESFQGEGNVSANRGLCYIVFSNFALADFGNRLPQMAAEVYVGTAQDVVKTDIDFLSGTSFDNFNTNAITADFDRGYYYLITQGGDDQTERGIRRFRMNDGVEDLQIPVSDMGIDGLFPESPPPSDHGFRGVQAVLSNGEIVIAYDGTNFCPVAVLDPYSYKVIRGPFGYAHSFSGANTLRIPVIASGGAAAPSSLGRDFYMHNGQFGDMAIIDIYSGEYDAILNSIVNYKVWEQDMPSTTASSRVRCVGRDLKGIGPTFYIMVHAANNNVKLYRVDAPQTKAVDEPAEMVHAFTSPGGGANLNGRHIVWDSGNPGCLLFLNNSLGNWLVKWSEDTGTIAWELKVSGVPVTELRPSRIINNEFSWVADNRVYIVNTATGEFIDRNGDVYVGIDDDQLPLDAFVNDGSSGIAIGGGSTASTTQFYDGLRGVVVTIGASGARRQVYPDFYDSQAVTLASIVESLLRRGGQTATDFDLSALESTLVKGYGFAALTDVKGVLSELRNVFLFDIVESDGRLKAVMRGKEDPDEEINSLVLGSSGDDASDFWKETRLSEADLPAQVSLTYMNVDDDFEQSTARSKRVSNPIPTMFSRQQLQFEASIVFNATEAKNRVNAILYTQWDERTKHNTRLPWAYLYLEPSDVIKVDFADGRSYLERLHQMEIGADFVIETETFGQDSGSYATNMIGEGGGAGRTQVIGLPKPARPFIYNLPLFRDSDDAGGGVSVYYTAAGNGAPGAFFGAGIFRSINNLDYDDLYQENEGVQWGTVPVATPSPSHGYYALDWETRITIFPASDDFLLEPITDDELYGESANAVIIGNEIMQFRDCVQNENGSWTIWNLLRGRRGTEWACDTHGRGETASFPLSSNVETQFESLDSTSKLRYFKAVGQGRSIANEPAISISYQPRDLMPYAVNDIRREIEIDDDIMIRWARRTRMGGDLMDGTPTVPLNETSEAYEIYILASPFTGNRSLQSAPITFVRMLTSNLPAVNYTSAMQTADGFDPDADTLHVVIYQISGAVGRGFPAPRSISPSEDF